MTLNDIIESIKGKFVKPRVYAIVAKCPNGSFLILESAYDLETAYVQGKKNFLKDNPKWNMNGVKIDMFIEAEYESLLESVMSLAPTLAVVPPESPPAGKAGEKKVEDKNSLMLRIVETKDAVLLEEKREMFSEVEYAYLTAKLNSKKK